jgi:hypothetical protein
MNTMKKDNPKWSDSFITGTLLPQLHAAMDAANEPDEIPAPEGIDGLYQYTEANFQTDKSIIDSAYQETGLSGANSQFKNIYNNALAAMYNGYTGNDVIDYMIGEFDKLYPNYADGYNKNLATARYTELKNALEKTKIKMGLSTYSENNVVNSVIADSGIFSELTPKTIDSLENAIDTVFGKPLPSVSPFIAQIQKIFPTEPTDTITALTNAILVKHNNAYNALKKYSDFKGVQVSHFFSKYPDRAKALMYGMDAFLSGKTKLDVLAAMKAAQSDYPYDDLHKAYDEIQQTLGGNQNATKGVADKDLDDKIAKSMNTAFGNTMDGHYKTLYSNLFKMMLTGSPENDIMAEFKAKAPGYADEGYNAAIELMKNTLKNLGYDTPTTSQSPTQAALDAKDQFEIDNIDHYYASEETYQTDMVAKVDSQLSAFLHAVGDDFDAPSTKGTILNALVAINSSESEPLVKMYLKSKLSVDDDTATLLYQQLKAATQKQAEHTQQEKDMQNGDLLSKNDTKMTVDQVGDAVDDLSQLQVDEVYGQVSALWPAQTPNEYNVSPGIFRASARRAIAAMLLGASYDSIKEYMLFKSEFQKLDSDTIDKIINKWNEVATSIDDQHNAQPTSSEPEITTNEPEPDITAASPDQSITSAQEEAEKELGDYFAQLLLGSSQVKAVNTFLTNPSKYTGKIPTTQDAIDWFKKAVHKEGKSMEWKWQSMAMALVKNHGVPLSDIPDELIPDNVKTKIAEIEAKKLSKLNHSVSTQNTPVPVTPTVIVEPTVQGQLVTMSKPMTDFHLYNFIKNYGGLEQSLDVAKTQYATEKNNPKSDKTKLAYLGSMIGSLENKLQGKTKTLPANVPTPPKEKTMEEKTAEWKTKGSGLADEYVNKFFFDPSNLTDTNGKTWQATPENVTKFKQAIEQAYHATSWSGTKTPLKSLQNNIPGFTYEHYLKVKEFMRDSLTAHEAEYATLQPPVQHSYSSSTTPENAEFYHKLFGDDAPSFEDVPTLPANDQRTMGVFARVAKETGFGIGQIGNSNSKERQTLKTIIAQVLTSKNPQMAKQAADGIHKLAINPVVVHSFMKAIRDERAKPGVNMQYLDPVTPHATTAQASVQPVQTSTSTTKPALNLYTKLHITDKTKDKPQSFSDILMSKYKISEYAKQQAVADIFNATLAFPAHNSEGAVKFCKNKLQQMGLDDYQSKNIANWAGRLIKDNHPLAIAAQSTKMQQHSQIINPATHTDSAALQYISKLTNSQDPKGLARNALVKGEKVILTKNSSGVPKWTVPDDNNHYSSNATALGIEQEAWRKQHMAQKGISEHEFEYVADKWQGGGQWNHDLSDRKKENYVLTKLIEGEPPSMTPVKDCLERGIRLNNAENLQDFLQAFEIGKLVYLGPSGFTERKYTARHGAGGASNGGNCSVLLRAFPQKNGMMKGCRVHDRQGSGTSFSDEKEVILGTSRNMRVREVIKHVVDEGGYEPKVCYEIVMDQEPDHIMEHKSVIADGGFDAKLWKGLSRNTVKMLIKYMNSSIDHRI